MDVYSFAIGESVCLKNFLVLIELCNNRKQRERERKKLTGIVPRHRPIGFSSRIMFHERRRKFWLLS